MQSTPPPDFEAIFEAIRPYYLVVLPDAEGTVVAATGSLVKAAGVPREQIVGRAVKALFPEEMGVQDADSTARGAPLADSASEGGGTSPHARPLAGSAAPVGAFSERFRRREMTPVFVGGRAAYFLLRLEEAPPGGTAGPSEAGPPESIAIRSGPVGAEEISAARLRADGLQATLAAIVESSDDAIVGKTLDGIILTWNNGAERIFGYTPSEAIGSSILMLIPPHRHPEEQEIQARLARGEQITHFETVRVTKSGREIDVSLTVSPIRDSSGNIVGASKILRDITLQKRAEEALAHHARELARSNLDLERYAYVASHDLLEPMRTIRSFAQLLKRNWGQTIRGEAEEFLDFIVSGAERMHALINDLLGYSRVHALGAAFVPVDCNEICALSLRNLNASIESSDARITVHTLPTVLADRTQLGQVFQNLLVNAMKFRGRQPPVIDVSAHETESEWVFTVSDNGIGIEQEYFERIFIIFQRLHTMEEYAGTGIGLALCKKIVERHGGRIWVESEVGKGSRFHFSIAKRGNRQ